MPDPSLLSDSDPVHRAYQEGRRMGLATGALVLSIVAYLNLLGIEKSLLAGVLAILALRGSESFPVAFSRARAALAIASIHALTVIVALVLFREKLKELIQLLHTLG